MRITALIANLLLLSFSAVAQQTPGAALPAFQAKRLPPEKTVQSDTNAAVANPTSLQLPLTAIQGPNLNGITVPANFKQKTDVALTKTAQDAVQMSEKWMAEQIGRAHV